MRNLFILFLVLASLLWFWGLKRAGTLFVLVVREGRIARSRGRIPPRLMAEIADIVDRAGVTRARIRGVVREGRPVLLFEGEMDPSAAQQMRNVMGQFTAGQIRSGTKH